MAGGSFEGNMDLYLANHSPGAVDKLIFYSVCKPTFIRANLHIQNIWILKGVLYLHVLAKPIANTLLFM